MKSTQEAPVRAFEAADMEQAVQRRLEGSEYAALQDVRCRYREGAVLLSGRVPSYYHKQLAQEAIRSLPGVIEIINSISVRRHNHPCRAGRSTW